MLTLLDNRMFDDGSLECKSWVLANHDEAWIVEWSTVQAKYPELVETIKQRVQDGHFHLNLTKCPTKYGDGVLEIQWD